MNSHVTSALARRTESTTRRASLLVLGGAALTALPVHFPATQAKKSKNKAKKRANKKVGQRCRKQGAACQEFASDVCVHFHAPGPIRNACVARANACCASIEECQGEDYFACLIDHVRDLVPV